MANGLYCTSEPQNVANFNSMMWITTEKHRWIQKRVPSDGLTVCCGDIGLMTEQDKDCDIPVCDCASLFAGQAELGGYTALGAKYWDDPIFVGKCHELGFSSTNFSTAGLLMTSLGLTWPELYDSSYELAQLAEELRNTGWPTLKAAIRNNSAAIQNASENHPDITAAIDRWYGLKTGAITHAPTPPPTAPTPAPCQGADTCNLYAGSPDEIGYTDPLLNCTMCALSSVQGDCATDALQSGAANPSCTTMIQCSDCTCAQEGSPTIVCTGPSTPSEAALAGMSEPASFGKCACSCSCYTGEYTTNYDSCTPPDWASWPIQR